MENSTEDQTDNSNPDELIDPPQPDNDELLREFLSENIKELRRHPLLRVGAIASILTIILGSFGLYFQRESILTQEREVWRIEEKNDDLSFRNTSLQASYNVYEKERGTFNAKISNLQNEIKNQRNKIYQFKIVDTVRNELIANKSTDTKSQLQNSENLWSEKFSKENDLRVSLEGQLKKTETKLVKEQKQVRDLEQEKTALTRSLKTLANAKLDKENYVHLLSSDNELLVGFISLRSERYKRSSWRKYQWDLNAHLEYPAVLRDELSKAVTNVYYTLSGDNNTKKRKPWAKHTKQGDKFFPFDINTNTPIQEITAHITFRGEEVKRTVSAPIL